MSPVLDLSPRGHLCAAPLRPLHLTTSSGETVLPSVHWEHQRALYFKIIKDFKTVTTAHWTKLWATCTWSWTCLYVSSSWVLNTTKDAYSAVFTNPLGVWFCFVFLANPLVYFVYHWYFLISCLNPSEIELLASLFTRLIVSCAAQGVILTPPFQVWLP